MTTFIMTGRYTTEAIKKITGKRTTKAHEIVKKCGGKIVSAYAMMGETDVLAVMEFSSINDAIKASVALSKALEISFSTVPAIRIEEFDKLVGGKA